MSDTVRSDGDKDDLLKRMINSRNGAAVLKARLAILRGERPECIVLAFEGDDDKSSYNHWLRRVRSDLDYEPFPCEGKSGVFDLQDAVDRDLSNLRRGVYFFVDRDFDDLRERCEDSRVFMTERYSIENYLVTETVLLELLKDEFHCHGKPAVRERIIRLFHEQLDAFTTTIEEINFRIYISRKLKIEIDGSIPSKTAKFATVTFNSVTPSKIAPQILIRFAAEPLDADRVRLLDDFKKLSPRDRYRGKLFYQFFVTWLRALAEERRRDGSAIFAGCENKTVDTNSFTVGALAAKSVFPSGLQKFAASICY